MSRCDIAHYLIKDLKRRRRVSFLNYSCRFWIIDFTLVVSFAASTSACRVQGAQRYRDTDDNHIWSFLNLFKHCWKFWILTTVRTQIQMITTINQRGVMSPVRARVTRSAPRHAHQTPASLIRLRPRWLRPPGLTETQTRSRGLSLVKQTPGSTVISGAELSPTLK